MRKKCTKNNCPAPKGMCIDQASMDHPKCEHWLGVKIEQTAGKQKKTNGDAHLLPWTGEPFQPVDIEIVSQRSTPLVIGWLEAQMLGKLLILG